MIAKRRDAAYGPDERSGTWVKLKLDQQQEFVVGGYRANGADSFDSLLVGVYEGRRLLFAGKLRAGFTPHVRRELARRLNPLIAKECPFVNLPDERHGRWGSRHGRGHARADVDQARSRGADPVRGVDRRGPAAARELRRRAGRQEGLGGAAREAGRLDVTS